MFQKSTRSSQRVVLWGLEGIGKSQIALKYAEHCSSARSTFWVKAGTRNDVLSGLKRIILVVLKGKQGGNPNCSLQEQIQELLGNEDIGEWLLVLDGADDKDIFTDKKGDLESLSNYIPNVSHGQVLVTTTDARIIGLNQGYFAPAQNGIHVTPLTMAESVELLQTSIHPEVHQERGINNEFLLQRIVKILDCLPIALCHAIAQIADGVPLKEFVQNFESQRIATSKTAESNPDPGLVTFELSYLRLCKPNESHEKLPEAKLLDILACLDGREIPKRSIEAFYKAEIESVKSFDMAMARLRSLSFVEYTPLNECYWLLSIVQNWTFERLTEKEKTQNEDLVHKALVAAASKTPSRIALALEAYQARAQQPETHNFEAEYMLDSPDNSPFTELWKLGVGSSGHVCAVRRTSGPSSGTVYARKIFRAVTRRDEMMNIGKREAKMLTKLRHKHIIECVSTISTSDTFALILYPVGERDLSYIISNTAPSGAMGVEEQSNERRMMMCKWFGCLAEAVDYVHNEGILIGDIKPHNIVVHKGEVILIDFAYSIGADELQDDLLMMPTTQEFAAPERFPRPSPRFVTKSMHRSHRKTRTYRYGAHFQTQIGDYRWRYRNYFPAQIGGYMAAPESMLSRTVFNFKSDIFSLGCVFLELLNHLMNESHSTFATYRKGGKGSRGNISFGDNLEKILRWIWYLSTKYGTSSHTNDQPALETRAHSSRMSRASLVDHAARWCFVMLQPHPENRCSATQLVQMIAASRLPVFCEQCKPELVSHERFLPSVNIVGASTPQAALDRAYDFTWDMANESWTSGLDMVNGPLRI